MQHLNVNRNILVKKYKHTCLIMINLYSMSSQLLCTKPAAEQHWIRFLGCELNRVNHQKCTKEKRKTTCINVVWPIDNIWWRSTLSLLVHKMTFCCLDTTRLKLISSQIYPLEETSAKFYKKIHKHFLSRKYIWKLPLQNGNEFVPTIDMRIFAEIQSDYGICVTWHFFVKTEFILEARWDFFDV